MGPFSIEPFGDERFRLIVNGEVTKGQISTLKDVIDQWPAALPPPGLIVDLRETDQIERDARLGLVEVHQALKAKAGRSVYIAHSPLLRGLALWVIHMAGDQRAEVVGSMGQAHAWLESEDGRVASRCKRIDRPVLPLRSDDGPFPPLNTKEKIASKVGGFFTRVTQGYWLAFLEELIRTFGVDALEQVGQQNEDILSELTERFDEEIAQLVVGMAALWNGCSYCGAGHIYACNLLYFKRTGQLFPLYERDVPTLQRYTDANVLSNLRSRFADEGAERYHEIIERQYQLKVRGVEPESDDDRLLLKACSTWDLVNECSIVVQLDDVPPLHPAMAKSRGLQKAYSARRRSAR